LSSTAARNRGSASAGNGSDGAQSSIVLGPRDRLVGQLYVEGDIRVVGTVEGGLEVTGSVEIDDGGRVVNPKFRDYHLPSFADIPHTEVLFADTSDTLGPMGAKSMSESPYNPVAAALGNAIANATGIRFTATPFKPDRLWPLLHEKFGSG